MNNIINFFKLIRVENLIILFFTQIMFYYYINGNFGNISLYLLLIISFLVAASGYIINDIYDEKSDRINKESVIIGDFITSRKAIFFYYSFNILAVLISIYMYILDTNKYFSLSIYPEFHLNCKSILLFVIISSIFLLKWYSKSYKYKFFVGNFIVSFLISLSIFNVILLECFQSSLNFIYYQLPFIVFSFTLTFAREIIKDLEDVEGDKIMKSNCIASKLNLHQTKYIIIFTLLITLLVFICWSILFNYFKILTIYNIFISLIIIISIYKVIISKNKKDFKQISFLLKIIMILGILIIPLYFQSL